MKTEGLAAWRRGGGGEPGGSLGSKVCRPAASPPLGSSAGAGMPGGWGGGLGSGAQEEGSQAPPSRAQWSPGVSQRAQRHQQFQFKAPWA